MKAIGQTTATARLFPVYSGRIGQAFVVVLLRIDITISHQMCRNLLIRLQVTNSLTGLERYKSDTSRLLPTGSDFSKHNEVLVTKKQKNERTFTDEEIKRLAQYMDLLIQMDFEQKRKQTTDD